MSCPPRPPHCTVAGPTRRGTPWTRPASRHSIGSHAHSQSATELTAANPYSAARIGTVLGRPPHPQPISPQRVALCAVFCVSKPKQVDVTGAHIFRLSCSRQAKHSQLCRLMPAPPSPRKNLVYVHTFLLSPRGTDTETAALRAVLIYPCQAAELPCFASADTLRLLRYMRSANRRLTFLPPMTAENVP